MLAWHGWRMISHVDNLSWDLAPDKIYPKFFFFGLVQVCSLSRFTVHDLDV